MRRTLWSNPEGFSIHDLLAICFASTFLLSAIYIMIKPAIEQIEVLRVLSQPVMVILGGYFGDQIVKGYQESKREQMQEVKDFRDSV